MPNRRLKDAVISTNRRLVWVLAVIAVPISAAAYNPEFCEVLNRFNAEKEDHRSGGP